MRKRPRMTVHWTIYLLTVPTSSETVGFYVGQTRQQMSARMAGHVYDARTGRCGGRFQALLAFYNMPSSDIIRASVLTTCTTSDDADRTEKHFIRYFNNRGCDMLNRRCVD